jgi:phosphatidyl-myo-inositol alpha-mannosyltransferase
MNKPKIIFSSYDDIHNPFYGGGGATAIHKIASSLSDAYTVTVITGSYPGSQNGRFDGVSYLRIGPKFIGPKLGQLVFQLLLPFYAGFLDYSLWIESFTPPFSTSCLQLFTKRPVIGLAHMLAAKDMKRKYHLPFDVFERIGLKFYKYIITTSESFEDVIKQLAPDSTTVCIANGVDAGPASGSASRPDSYLLFLGRIEVDQKGLDLLITAYSQFSPNLPNKLVIAGSGTTEELRKLRRLIKARSLTAKVDLLGKVEGAAKIKLIRQASCVVLPSRFETFSMVALETVTNGTPLVTFDIEGLRWLPASCSLKTSPFDLKELSRNIIKAVTDPDTRQLVITHGLKLSQKYSWVKSTTEYKKFIHLVLSHDHST